VPFTVSTQLSRRRLFWILQIGGWTGIVPISVTLNILLGIPPKIALVTGLCHQIAGFLATLGLWRAYRHWLAKTQSPLHLALPALGFVGLATLVDTLLFRLMAAVLSLHDMTGPWALTQFATLFGRFLALGGWSAMYFLLHQLFDRRDQERQLHRAETAAREAELATLRAQINPHVLFNALNSILAECDDNPRAVRTITRALADYLRSSLLHQGHHAPLAAELSTIAGYLGVEQSRFEERLVHTLDIEPAARAAIAPTAVLLPLVENALKYGMRTSPIPLRVAITARLRQNRLTLSVENSGHWLEPQPDRANSTQIGLVNLRRRLALLHGDDAHLTIEHDDRHVRVTVNVPAGDPLATSTATERPRPA
jgi:two-component sensor histidine kinase